MLKRKYARGINNEMYYTTKKYVLQRYKKAIKYIKEFAEDGICEFGQLESNSIRQSEAIWDAQDDIVDRYTKYIFNG